MLFFVSLTVLELLSYSLAADVFGVVGDDVTFKWNLTKEALLVLFARSNRVELGEWFGGEFKPENPYKGRLEYSDMDHGTAILMLMSTIETDYDQTYSCETCFKDSSCIAETNTLRRQDDISPGNRVEITQWCLFLPGLLYIMLGNKGVTQFMVWSFIFLLVLKTSTCTAMTDDNCSY